jgi:HSP20 family protein
VAGSSKTTFIEELKAMKERMEELFLRNFDTEEQEAAQDIPAADWIPLTDITDTGKELVYVLDLPGVLDSGLQVEFKADRLWVSGSRPNDLPEGEPLRIERPKGAFSRIFKFPCAIEVNDIRAEFRKGVLRVTVPKVCSSSNKSQRIVVKGEE